MKIKQIKLIENASSVEVKVKEEITTINFLSPIWQGKNCIYEIPGVWELESVSGSDVTLVNHDEIIPLNGN